MCGCLLFLSVVKVVFIVLAATADDEIADVVELGSDIVPNAGVVDLLLIP